MYEGRTFTARREGYVTTLTAFAMDTYMTVSVRGIDSFEAAKAAGELIEEYDSLFSVSGSGSDIAAINSAAGEPVNISSETLRQITAYIEVSGRSGGAFDITVEPLADAWGFSGGSEYRIPSDLEISQLLDKVDYSRIQISGNTLSIPDDMKISLGATAKGYTSDALVALFGSYRVDGAVISLGGNVQTFGTKKDGSEWIIAIQDPNDPERYTGTVSVSETAVVTSGNYQRYFESGGKRYGHIIDPATGYPVQNGLLSATVICHSGLLSDCLSTALFVLGEEGAKSYYETYGGFDMILITSDGRIIVTSGIAGSYTQEKNSPYILEVF